MVGESALLKIKILDDRLRENFYQPKPATSGAAGIDLRASLSDCYRIAPRETAVFHTGLAVAIPSDCVGLVCIRSGLSKGFSLANGVGVIDSDYRGEIKVALYNRTEMGRVVEPMERVAQLIVVPVYMYGAQFVEELPETERGEGGFGSTGVK